MTSITENALGVKQPRNVDYMCLKKKMPLINIFLQHDLEFLFL